MWQTVNFTLPDTAAGIKQDSDSVLTAVSGEMSAAQSRLSGVAGFIPVTPSPISGNAGNAADLTNRLKTLLAVNAQFICVHPYVHPVGDKRGDYTYLSPSGCRDAVLAKLADPYEKLPASECGALFLKITGYDHADMAAKLAVFNNVFPVTSLQLVQRRAADLSVHENEKYIFGNGFISPKFQSLEERQHQTNKMMDARMARLVAVSHGYDTQNIRPESLLSELINKKRIQTEQADEVWKNLCSSFSGGSGNAAYLSGSVRQIRHDFSRLAIREGAHILSVICCWIGEAEAMTVFREVLGI
ncbi:hypothetical protein [Maridesulfovibrio zosterae]|uniref:hypothetical protein n=1 Tax=Maridesulfovibrio zosterae TaxID=82171 RepID=UPI00040F0762|nr:hypothetical protein [Maridesulfovibrio zosterae]